MWPLWTSPEGPSGTGSSILLQHSGGSATAGSGFCYGGFGFSSNRFFLFNVF